jgi:hypothetical protein
MSNIINDISYRKLCIEKTEIEINKKIQISV